MPSFLSREPIDADVDSLFTDWTVANLLQDPAVDDGRYAYAGGGFHAALTGTASRDDAVPGFGAAVRGQLRRPAVGRGERARSAASRRSRW